MTRYIFVTGGVVSSIGKGIVAASLGRLLKNRGLKVAIQKVDPYLNVDPGTMSPLQHGEVFVTDDGSETDLDLGHYERFIDLNLNPFANVTTGKVYQRVINRERRGQYDGATVQVIPHITDEIKRNIVLAGAADEADVVITEVGGTVGDIESLPFLEALRQMRTDVGAENVLYIHTTLLPYLKAASELKTKPTQHSVKELRGLGIQPNILVVRTEESLPESIKDKLVQFCDVEARAVIESRDVETLYTIPLSLQAQGMDDLVLDYFGMEAPAADMTAWRELEQGVLNLKEKVKVAIVGKYVSLPDAYLSAVEAVKHAGYQFNAEIDFKWVDSEFLTADNLAAELGDVDGMIVPGGFGTRGTEGKLLALEYARTHEVPMLGIGMGMQLAAVEFARHVAGLEGANSSEFDPETPHKIIDIAHGVDEDGDLADGVLGGTLRLGKSAIRLQEGSRVRAYYDDQEIIEERHRNRYEFNNEYRQALEEAGMTLSGISEDGELVEVVEISDHPFYIGCLYHAEFLSRPNRPHPLFRALVEACLDKQ